MSAARARRSKEARSEEPTALAGLGPGRPLEAAERVPLEQSFGTGLGDVRVHTDGAARRVASEHSVAAFAYGRDVGFAAGEYRPDTLGGRVMLAHEVAHAVQQRDAASVETVSPSAARAREGVRDPRLERDADRAAFGAVARHLVGVGGGEAGPRQQSGLRLSGCDKREDPAVGGGGVHLDEAINNMTHGSPDKKALEKAAPGMTMNLDPDKKEVVQHMTTMDAGSVYFFFGHGAQQAPGKPFVGINADDKTIFGAELEAAFSADKNPPTLVVLGACGSATLLHFVTKAGVPVAVGFSDSVSATLGASVGRKFFEDIMSGQSFAKALAEANASLAKGGAFNSQGAKVIIEYRKGYDGSMTLQQAQEKHKKEIASP